MEPTRTNTKMDCLDGLRGASINNAGGLLSASIGYIVSKGPHCATLLEKQMAPGQSVMSRSSRVWRCGLWSGSESPFATS